MNDVIQEAEKDGYTIVKALLTHGHLDHVDGAGEIADKLNVPVLISADEAPYYTPTDCENLETVKDGEKISIGNVEIDTPFKTTGNQQIKMTYFLGRNTLAVQLFSFS